MPYTYVFLSLFFFSLFSFCLIIFKTRILNYNFWKQLQFFRGKYLYFLKKKFASDNLFAVSQFLVIVYFQQTSRSFISNQTGNKIALWLSVLFSNISPQCSRLLFNEELVWVCQCKASPFSISISILLIPILSVCLLIWLFICLFVCFFVFLTFYLL